MDINPDNVKAIYHDEACFEYGKGRILKEGKDVCIVASGIMVQEALKAAMLLKQAGVIPTVVDISTIKPIDEDLLRKLAQEHSIMFTCEEHSIINGLGSAVCEVLGEYPTCRIVRRGIEDRFGESGKTEELFEKYGLSAEKIALRIGKEVFRVLKKKRYCSH